MQISQELVEWVTLSTIPRVGAKMMQRLLDRYGTPRAALSATQTDLKKISGIGDAVARQILKADMGMIETHLQEWLADGIRILTWRDVDYPAMLRMVDDAPPTLFMRGNWPTANTRTVAIVGTRRPSPRAARSASRLAETLAANGWTIVSGLALGIDTYAHKGALAAQGQTVAVLGGGLNKVYPLKSRKFSNKIVQHGALLSEVLPEVETNSPQLVARNRLISGLSRALIVVQAGPNSGSLHAARFAKKQDRLVCAVDIVAEGNVELVKDGAMLINHNLENIQDLLDALDKKGA